MKYTFKVDKTNTLQLQPMPPKKATPMQKFQLFLLLFVPIAVAILLVAYSGLQ